jgi:hypothetical protein
MVSFRIYAFPRKAYSSFLKLLKANNKTPHLSIRKFQILGLKIPPAEGFVILKGLSLNDFHLNVAL